MPNEYGNFILLLQSIGIGISAWVLKRIICIDRKIASFETWKEMHDKLDDERHEKLDKTLDALWSRK